MRRIKAKESLSSQAYASLRNLIITLDLKPGAQINEADLENKLSIGRTPVREAILRLVNEGFLASLPGRGFFVRQVSLEDVRAFFEAFMILERAAAGLAAKRIKPDRIKLLGEVNADLERAMSERAFLQITLQNCRFHRTIHEATGNDFLISPLYNLESQYDRLAYLCFSEETDADDLKAHFAKVIEDHEALIQCMREGDAQRAVETVTRHLHLFLSRVSEYLRPNMAILNAAWGPFLADAKTEAINL